MFKAVICDLDGTLLDTLEDLAYSMNTTLKEMGFPTHPTQDYRYFVGDGIEELARRVLPEEHRDENRILEAVQGMKETYSHCWSQKTRPYPGILELLERLNNQGIKLAVFSNKPHEFTTIMVHHYFSPTTFEVVLGVGGHIPKKPHPKGAEKILETLEISPKETIFLGDTRTDMETAVNGGLFGVGLLWGFREREELLRAGAKSILESPQELLLIVEGEE